jgi:two-component system sensor histidine kinase/response regulator
MLSTRSSSIPKAGKAPDAAIHALPARDSRWLSQRSNSGEITERNRAKEVARPTPTELEKKNAELERLNEFKSRSLASMSQEIRTALDAVTGMLHLLRQSALDEKQLSCVDKAQSASRSVLHVVDGLLDLSKIGSGRLAMDSIPFSLGEVLRSLADVAGAGIQGKPVELRCSLAGGVPDGLVGDPERLGQVLLNLVDDSVKFANRGEIVVSAEVEAILEGGVGIRFALRDTGPGMTPDQRARSLVQFHQAGTAQGRRHGDTGLGLAISKQLVDLMGGEIEVESEPGQGSTISFSVPFGVQAGETIAYAAGARAPQGPLILVWGGSDRALTETCAMHGPYAMQPLAAAEAGSAKANLPRAIAVAEKPCAPVLWDATAADCRVEAA